MDLSNDLISKFVKITNDGNKKETKEGTVYGTTVEYDGAMYVKIDGSDLLTPIDTTADIKENERVTIMIKDHNATVTGNITSPSASSADVKKVTRNVEEIEGEITQFEAIIADVIHVGELDAEVARIDELIAGKATIEELKATHAEIEILDAEVADINVLVNGHLTSDNILSFNITAQNTTMENAFVKDAMIDTVTANKIISGTIDTNNVTIQSTDGSMLLQGTLLQMKDDDGKVRIQIGKDTGGNFTFILYDESGTGVLIDEEGIKSSDAIADGLIVDAKVADNANISGSKLDIVSLITEVNNDNSTTIKSNKIFLNEQGQSLEVAFNSLKTQVETIQDVTISGDLSSIVEQVQSNTTQIEANKEGISTLVAENTIRKEEIQNLDGEIESVNTTLSSKYSSLEQDISGFKTTVADTYTTKSEFSNLTIGERNLIHNGNFRGAIPNSRYMPNPWNFWGNEIFIYGDQGESGYNHDGCVYIGCNNLTDDSAGFYSKGIHVSKLEKGVTYMASFILAKERNVRNATAYLEYINDTYDQIVYSQVLTTADVIYYHDKTNEHQYHIPFTMWTGEFSYLQIVFKHGGTYVPNNGYLMIVGNVQIKKGNKAADWTPAPEDIDEQISIVSSSLSQTAANLTATFTEMHNGGYSRGITTIDKDGIKVYQTNYSGYTHMCANGFYVHNGTEDVISCTYSGVVVKGNVTATSGKVANFTISGNDLIGSNVGMGGASGSNYAFWAGSNSSHTAPFRVGHDGSLVATNASITGGSIDIGGNFSVSSAGTLTTNSQIYAQGGIYTYQDIRGLDSTDKSGGLTIVTGTGHVAVRTENSSHSVYLQSASGEVKCTRPKEPDSYINIRAYNLIANNAVYANGVNVSSDKERKRDIELYETDALHEICTTPVYTYHLDTDLDEEIKRIGIIMQEAPLDAVDISGKGVDLYQMVTMLWRAVQQQQEMIKELKGE